MHIRKLFTEKNSFEMENHHPHHHFMLKVSRLFPYSLTSCQFRALPDVAESSITIPKTKITPTIHEIDPSPPPKTKLHHEKSSSILFPKKNPIITPGKRNLFSVSISDTEGRKCPPVTPISQNKKDRSFQEINKKKTSLMRSSVNMQSSSSNSGWFSSSGDEKYSIADSAETEAFFSLSSNSGDSFRLKTSRRFRRCDEMKSIDEMGWCSFSSSVASFDSVLSCRKTEKKPAGKSRNEKKTKSCPEYEMGSGQISAQIYYSNDRDDSRTSSRRRTTARTRRKTVLEGSSGRRNSKSEGFGASYAVEKSSRDPHADFRASMVEMIVEKQLFGAEDLERLLHCFLSLNATSYHGIIFEVFSDICETLFCN